MSFWNDPQNNSLKVLLVVVVIAIAGFFVYRHMNSGNAGRVIVVSGVKSSAGNCTWTDSSNGTSGWGSWDSATGCCQVSAGGCLTSSGKIAVTYVGGANTATMNSTATPLGK